MKYDVVKPCVYRCVFIVTPSIDPITQTLVAGPMIVLYFVGIAMAKLVEKTPIIPRY